MESFLLFLYHAMRRSAAGWANVLYRGGLSKDDERWAARAWMWA
jgi:hypothetical protein